MATCLGHNYGTGCFKNSKSPKSKNWKEHQFCYKCFCIIILKKKPHKGHGGKYLTEPKSGDLYLINTQCKINNN